MFGGSTSEPPAVLDDTWEWDGTAWTFTPTTHSPSPRTETSMTTPKAPTIIVA